MEFNKFVSASLVMGSLALVGCGDEHKKESDKVIEVPAPAPAPAAPDAVAPAAAPDAAVVTPPVVAETPNANVTVEETHKTETTTTPSN